MKRYWHPLRVPTLAIAASAAVLAALAPSAAAAPAQVDTTFGTNGVARISGGSSAWSMAAPDGSTIVVTNWRIVRRLDAQGRVDETFGTGGRVVFPADEGYSTGVVSPTGRVLLAGAKEVAGVDEAFTSRVVALDTTGAIDTSWGTGGVALPGVTQYGHGATLDADGRLLVVGGGVVGGTGTIRTGDTLVVRYTTAGQLDTTFGGGDGVFVADRAPDGDDGANDVEATADGRVLVALWSDEEASQRQVLLRLDPSGSLDTTFGTGGIVRLGALDDADNSMAQQLLLDPAGRILVIGSEGASRIVVRRFGADGAVDTTWGVDGLSTSAIIDPFAYLVTSDVFAARDSAGRVVVGTGANHDLVVARFTASGRPDRSWSNSGLAYYGLGFGVRDFDELGGITVDSGDRILLVGAGRHRVGGSVRSFISAVRIVGGGGGAASPTVATVASCPSDSPCARSAVMRVRVGGLPIDVPVLVRAVRDTSVAPSTGGPTPLPSEPPIRERRFVASPEMPARTLFGLYPQPGRYVVEVRVPATRTTKPVSVRRIVTVSRAGVVR